MGNSSAARSSPPPKPNEQVPTELGYFVDGLAVLMLLLVGELVVVVRLATEVLASLPGTLLAVAMSLYSSLVDFLSPMSTALVTPGLPHWNLGHDVEVTEEGVLVFLLPYLLMKVVDRSLYLVTATCLQWGTCCTCVTGWCLWQTHIWHGSS